MQYQSRTSSTPTSGTPDSKKPADSKIVQAIKFLEAAFGIKEAPPLVAAPPKPIPPEQSKLEKFMEEKFLDEKGEIRPEILAQITAEMNVVAKKLIPQLEWTGKLIQDFNQLRSIALTTLRELVASHPFDRKALPEREDTWGAFLILDTLITHKGSVHDLVGCSDCRKRVEHLWGTDNQAEILSALKEYEKRRKEFTQTLSSLGQYTTFLNTAFSKGHAGARIISGEFFAETILAQEANFFDCVLTAAKIDRVLGTNFTHFRKLLGDIRTKGIGATRPSELDLETLNLMGLNPHEAFDPIGNDVMSLLGKMIQVTTQGCKKDDNYVLLLSDVQKDEIIRKFTLRLEKAERKAQQAAQDAEKRKNNDTSSKKEESVEVVTEASPSSSGSKTKSMPAEALDTPKEEPLPSAESIHAAAETTEPSLEKKNEGEISERDQISRILSDLGVPAENIRALTPQLTLERLKFRLYSLGDLLQSDEMIAAVVCSSPGMLESSPPEFHTYIGKLRELHEVASKATTVLKNIPEPLDTPSVFVSTKSLEREIQSLKERMDLRIVLNELDKQGYDSEAHFILARTGFYFHGEYFVGKKSIGEQRMIFQNVEKLLGQDKYTPKLAARLEGALREMKSAGVVLFNKSGHSGLSLNPNGISGNSLSALVQWVIAHNNPRDSLDIEKPAVT